jgi:hypothetical protein
LARDTDWSASAGSNYGLSTHRYDPAGANMRAWIQGPLADVGGVADNDPDWHMMAVSVDLNVVGSEASFYVDGAPVGSASINSSVTTIAGDGVLFSVGNRCGGGISCAGNDLDGQIDELAVFNTALSGPQIQGLYDAATLAVVPNVVTSANVVVDDVLGTSFSSVSNETYRLQSTPDLLSSNFSDTGAIAIGNGGDMTLFDPTGPSASKNYRVKQDQ